ncbi:hypothetical protein NQD34_004547 [Periophthalmus magnuspinnatus]|nr:hypothetical protein NQD34_004547 [Periophthalmus magnuspinnatus]
MPSTEPWVGSWRPHKPRGPIAAMYKSPGPKYSLPGLTGDKVHCLTKLKAPNYSFGTRHELSASNLSPGPRYLVLSNITRVGRDGTPAFSLQGHPKDPRIFQAPAPGHYSPEKSTKSIFRSSPAFSLSGKPKESTNGLVPGPASYQLPEVIGGKTVVTSAAPMYSLCGRSKTGGFADDLRKTPGPAAYNVVDSSLYKEKPPQFSMAARTFVPGDITKKPGPGAHCPERVTSTRAKAPSFSFGLRHSEYIAPLIVDGTE